MLSSTKKTGFVSLFYFALVILCFLAIGAGGVEEEGRDKVEISVCKADESFLFFDFFCFLASFNIFFSFAFCSRTLSLKKYSSTII
jgi:hypothetical protein